MLLIVLILSFSPGFIETMSERMIELQRERLLAASSAASPGGPSTTLQAGGTTHPSANPAAGSNANLSNGGPSLSSQASAANKHGSTTASRDAHLALFLDLLPNHPPTTPIPLTRRILQRQGVGTRPLTCTLSSNSDDGDDMVSALVSSAADQFLATVLSQAMACREQRLQGADMAEETRHKQYQHTQAYQSDWKERKRKRLEYERALEKANMAIIEAAKNKSAKSKTPAIPKPKEPPSEDEYNSVDEEEEYYKKRAARSSRKPQSEAILLRDLAKPLLAWDFHLTGKRGLENQYNSSDEEESDTDDDDENEESGDELDEDGENGETNQQDDSSQKSPKNKGSSGRKTPLAGDDASVKTSKSAASRKITSSTGNGNAK